MKNHRGFTLIELVVVIAILGILAGIAIPRFLDAQATARGARVLANLRTMDSAIQQFMAYSGEKPKDLQELVPSYLAQVPAAPSSTFSIIQNNGKKKDFLPAASEYAISADGRAIYDCEEVGKHTVEWYLTGVSSEDNGGTNSDIKIANSTDWSTISGNSKYKHGYQGKHGQILSDGTGYYVLSNNGWLPPSATASNKTLAQVAVENSNLVKINNTDIYSYADSIGTSWREKIWKDTLPQVGSIYKVGSDNYLCLQSIPNRNTATDPLKDTHFWKKVE